MTQTMNTKTKMDNNMTAIVSIIMIGLGFMNGMIVTTLLDRVQVEKTNGRLQKILDDKFELEQDLDELRDELAQERREKQHILAKLNSIVRQYTELPPPEGPIQRSQACSEATSDDDEFPNPASPDVVPKHTD